MADGIYVGMSGAVARSAQLDSIADNLANAQTPGFKASRPSFESFLPPGERGEQAYTAAVAAGVDMSPGPTTITGNALDVTPVGNTFLAVQTPSGGVAYTRNGKLSVDVNGQMMAANCPLLDSQGAPIMVPLGEQPVIAPSGAVTVKGEEVGRIATWALTGPTDRMGASLLVPSTVPGSEGAVEAADGQVRVGQIELGNFTPLEAAVQLVSAQRQFESSMQAIEIYKRMGDKANEVGRTR